MPKFSIIMPICETPPGSGALHHGLPTAIRSVLDSPFKDWELLIGTDGEIELAKAMVLGFADDRIKLHGFPYTGNWGNPIRNALIERATGERIIFLDQDDGLERESLPMLDQIDGLFPGRLIVCDTVCPTRAFRIPGGPVRLGNSTDCLNFGSISAACLVPPNRKELIGRFIPEEYREVDYEFCKQTIENFRAAGIEPVWTGHILNVVHPWEQRAQMQEGYWVRGAWARPKEAEKLVTAHYPPWI